MSSAAMLCLFAVFGGVCGFYVSVVGFALTAIGVCVLVGLANPFVGEPFTPLFLLAAFVAQQVGYGLAVIGSGVALSFWRNRPASRDAAAEGELGADRDRIP